MKKVIFCVYGLGIGGIEKCLVNLVNKLDLADFDVSIATMNPEYDLLHEIKQGIKIIKFEDYFINTTDTYKQIKSIPISGKKIEKLVRYVLYRLAVKFKLSPWKFHYSLQDEYDLAIAYSHTGNVPNYVSDCVRAKKKILWYHTLWKNPELYNVYKKFDSIVAVSETCRNNFCDCFPELESKVTVIHNIYDDEKVKTGSESLVNDFDTNCISIVTVGRLSDEKGFKLAIDTCEILKTKLNLDFKWYWVGDGPAYKKAECLIYNAGLTKEFILLGKKDNPYPYMRLCNIYVQPSLSEAYCTTVMEAKMLNKAIVTTNVKSFYEQINHEQDGMISEGIATELAFNIETLLKDNELKNKIEKNSNFKLKQDANLKKHIQFFKE